MQPGQYFSKLVVVCHQALSCVQLFATPWTAPLSFTISQSLLRFMSIESVLIFNHLILCCPLLLSPSIFPSIRVFSSESVLHIRWTKYLSFSFSISPYNEYSGLISFRIDWFDLLAVQGALKKLNWLQQKLNWSLLQSKWIKCSSDHNWKQGMTEFLVEPYTWCFHSVLRIILKCSRVLSLGRG